MQTASWQKTFHRAGDRDSEEQLLNWQLRRSVLKGFALNDQAHDLLEAGDQLARLSRIPGKFPRPINLFVTDGRCRVVECSQNFTRMEFSTLFIFDMIALRQDSSHPNPNGGRFFPDDQLPGVVPLELGLARGHYHLVTRLV